MLLLLAAPAAAALRATTDVNTTITIGGSPVTVTLPTAGEIGYVTFAGSSGQNLGLGLSANTIGTVTVTVKRPDGSTLASKLLVGSADELDFTLNVSGTYTIVVDPYQTATGSITLTLSEDLVSSISIGGSSTTVTTTRAGENARVTFSGTSGQNLGLGITGNTTTGVQVLVRRPDGSTLSSGIFVASGERDFTLDVTGSFTMFVDPIEARTGSITFTLSEDLVATIAIGGSTTSVTTTRPGENARITFSGTAGQHLGVGLTANTTTGLELSVKSPAWTTVSSAILVSIGELDASLTASGTHTSSSIRSTTGRARSASCSLTT